MVAGTLVLIFFIIRLPASLARIPPVAQRLQMSERSILSRLMTSHSGSSGSDSHQVIFGPYT